MGGAIYEYKAEALIGLGDIATAKEVLEKSIQQDAMQAKPYFLLGLVLMDEDKDAAEEAFKKAIYINSTFVEAHYHLALLYLSQQQGKAGIKHLEKAKKHGEEANQESRVMGCDGTVGDLAEVIAGDIVYHRGRLNER